MTTCPLCSGRTKLPEGTPCPLCRATGKIGRNAERVPELTPAQLRAIDAAKALGQSAHNLQWQIEALPSPTEARLALETAQLMVSHAKEIRAYFREALQESRQREVGSLA